MGNKETVQRPLYRGTKEIYAQPMNRLEYNKYMGWKLPKNQNGEDEGYLVEYTDGGTPNHENHKGYISWSPKEVFEGTYKVIEESTFETRVLEERKELAEKLSKLETFLLSKDSKRLPEIAKNLLYGQKNAMANYLHFLEERIKGFKK